MSRLVRLALLACVLPVVPDALVAQERGPWRAPEPLSVRPPVRGDAPLLACTAAELARLRKALRDGSPAVTQRVARARQGLSQVVRFPPRGGQHNQWYQCDRCQLALRTIDATHHRCGKCEKVYSGPPYDDVLFSRVHSRNMSRAHDAAWAYALTGERRFASHAIRILVGYAERYRSYPYHTSSPSRDRQARKQGRALGTSGGHIKEQTLSEASMMIGTTLPAIDLVWPALTEAQRRRIIDDLVRPMLDNIAKCRRGKSNWQSFHNAAMFAGGVITGQARFMRRALFDRRDGFVAQMRISVTDDGMWYENSWGYHLYTLRALADLAENARRCGIDLWSHPQLRKMCALPALYTMPGGRLPRFGDDVNSTARSAPAVFEAAFAATGDSGLSSLLGPRTAWDAILHGRGEVPVTTTTARTSVVFRSAGHAILRTDGPGALTAVLTFGPFGGFHGHFDKLSFVFYGFGEELGVDPGRARSQAYRLPIHKNWYRGTIAHNAVVVDGKPQRGAKGELLAFVTGAGFAAAAARTSEAYPGIDHARCLVLRDGYLLIVDRLAAKGPHDYAWTYHNRGSGVTCTAARGPAEELRMQGAEYLALTGSGKTDAPARARFAGTTVDTLLTLAAGDDTAIHVGTGVGASTLDRVPVFLAQRSGQRMMFAAVLEPVRKSARPGVEQVRVRPAPGESGSWTVEVRFRGRTDNVRWDGGRRLRVR